VFRMVEEEQARLERCRCELRICRTRTRNIRKRGYKRAPQDCYLEGGMCCVKVSLARTGRYSARAIFAAAALCSAATAFDGRCILQVRGKTYLNGIWNVEM